MHQVSTVFRPRAFRFPGGAALLFLLFCGGLLLVGYLFLPSLRWLVMEWSNKEEYSHGFLIPLITGYLIWQRRGVITELSQRGSWYGVPLLLAGLFGLLLGRYSTLFIISHYSLLLVLFGLVLCAFGGRITRQIWMPLALLILAIPLPNFLYNKISAQLQLISSALGVEFIRACSISVYLEGNVIDLGTMKLQVVEACNGLRYLFPLLSLAFICAYLFQAPLWQRFLVFVSSVPITVLMNSLRIGLIGVTVEYWGLEMAEGFLHDFEGWVVFMICTGLLLGEIWLLARWTPPKTGMRERFGLTTYPCTGERPLEYWRCAPPLLAGLSVLLLAAALLGFAPRDREMVPERRVFAEFPLQLGDWVGYATDMQQEFLDTLDLDDYLLADYYRDGLPVNLYVAYYDSQSSGQSAHSPRSCIPGGGWKIDSVQPVSLSDGVRANRVIIRRGDLTQVVYYWFDQRGRNLISEYLVKWYLFQDGLLRNRSDGALIRLTTPVADGESVERADQRVREFFSVVEDRLEQFVPAA